MKMTMSSGNTNTNSKIVNMICHSPRVCSEEMQYLTIDGVMHSGPCRSSQYASHVTVIHCIVYPV